MKAKSKNQKNKATIYFSRKDWSFIIQSVFKRRYGREEFFRKQLNSLIADCFLFKKNAISKISRPAPSYLKRELRDFDKTLKRLKKQLEEINKHDSAFYFLNEHDDILKTLELSGDTLIKILPMAIKDLSESQGRKRGKINPFHETVLLRGLLLIYEKYTDKNAKDNFKQQKTTGVDYSGECYFFTLSLLQVIAEKFKQKNIKNIFSIKLPEPKKPSLSLGKRIHKVFLDKKSLMISNLIFDKFRKK